MITDEHTKGPWEADTSDMLATLTWLRDEYCEGGMLDGTDAERRILAAIAKATGEQQ